MMNIKIATTNPVKIEAIKEVFERYFSTDNLKIQAIHASSGVSEQPINEEVFEGALNRIKNVKKEIEKNEYDYIVSCEGGLICLAGRWFNTQVVMIEDKKEKQSTGLSQSYPIPQKYVKRIMETSIATVLDEIFKGEGGIRKLTRNEITRKELVKSGTVMALTGIINGDKW